MKVSNIQRLTPPSTRASLTAATAAAAATSISQLNSPEPRHPPPKAGHGTAWHRLRPLLAIAGTHPRVLQAPRLITVIRLSVSILIQPRQVKKFRHIVSPAGRFYTSDTPMPMSVLPRTYTVTSSWLNGTARHLSTTTPSLSCMCNAASHLHRMMH